MKRIVCSVMGICVLAGAASADAQSLADLARKEQARRKAVQRPTKVYTNNDVAVVPPAAAAAEDTTKAVGEGTPEPPAEAAGEPGQPAQAGQAGAASGGATPGVTAGQEAQWRARVTQAREAVSRAQIQLEAMRAQVMNLQTSRALSQDSTQQTQLQRRQQDSLQEFDKLRADVEKHRKALADLEAEARQAGVPPGWIR